MVSMSPKIPYVPFNTPGDVADAIRKRRGGSLLDLDRMLLRNPAIAAGWNALLGAVRTQTCLSDAERELAICWVAVLNRAEYEWGQHAPLALEAGVPAKVMDQIEQGDVTGLDGKFTLVIDVTTALTKAIEIDDALFQQARTEFGEDGVHDLIATVATYNMVSRYLVGLGVGQ